MALLTIDAHNLTKEFKRDILKTHSVKVVDTSEAPWKVVFEGERSNLVNMVREHWCEEDAELVAAVHSSFISET